MSTSSKAADLLADFPHQELPKFTGKPTFTQVRAIEKLIEENAGSIESSVEGAGDFNHIFLIKTDEEWTELTGLPPVVLPVNPAEPVIRNNASAANIAQANQVYERNKRIYQKTKAMKNLLINQIISSFDSKYVDCLKHAVTRQINHQSIPEIFKILYRYGKVKSQAVRDKTQELLATEIDLDVPLLNVFKEIEDWKALAKAAGIPRSTSDVLDITLTKIKSCGSCFEEAVKAWNRRPEEEHTWANIMTHFEEAQQELEDATDLPIGRTRLHSANAMFAQEVAKNLDHKVEQKLNVLHNTVKQVLRQTKGRTASSSSLIDYANNYISSSDASDDEDNVMSDDDLSYGDVETPTTSLKNFFEEKLNSLQADHKKEIKALKQELKKVKSNKVNNVADDDQPPAKRTRSQKGSKKESTNDNASNDKVYRDGPRTRNQVNKYCWTHGACSHTSAECTRPGKGHQKKATFKNKMNGSLSFCQHEPK